ncbi:amino acid permease [Mesoplasma chauliocola]|uniref:Amino acid permease n=1 Tax=Mesoplasma chauliocola TaxID=216427 RepID=A0A249SP83_9MOLU|nr:APC family permease [Mesoplasma chauliocola]ASZ09430.1 amino acid permease [Mesoplasma chauliocola]
MFKKKNKSSKVYEFWYLFLLIIGICIGSGIYVKNQELISQTKSPWIATVLWLVIGMVCVISIVAFMEIAKSTEKQGNGTVSNWCKLFINRKFASFVSILYTTIYMPAYQSIFVSLTIAYFFVFTGVTPNPAALLSTYIIVGLLLFVLFAFVNVYSANASRKIQFLTMFIKFIPLIVAFFAGFIIYAINHKTMPGMGLRPNDQGEIVSPVFMNYLGGMGAILFSFDGYIFTANTQKSAKNKKVVPLAIIAGLIFITLFYVLMAFSLFLGGDGSVQSVLKTVFAGFNTNPSPKAEKAANTVVYLIMFFICLFNINMFTHFGTSNLLSDHNMKLVYLKEGKASFKTAAFTQAAISGTFYVALILIGGLSAHGGWNGISTVAPEAGKEAGYLTGPMFYVGIMSSVCVVLIFIVISILMISAMINRKTQKVKVDKVKFFWPAAIIGTVFFLFFTICGLIVFLAPQLLDPAGQKTKWTENGGMVFTIIFLITLVATIVVWLLQERMFKKYPFKNGFEGEIDPLMKVNNWMAAKEAQDHKELKNESKAKIKST